MFLIFLYSLDFYFTGARESRILDLLVLIRLTALHSTTVAFGSLRSSDAEKKRRPRLGIFRYRENRLVSSASLPLLSFGASRVYSEPREF